MASETQKSAATAGRLFCVLIAAVGFGGAGYFVASSRIPLVLAFLPVGEVTREGSPVVFWLMVMGAVVAGGLGLVGFFRRTA